MERKIKGSFQSGKAFVCGPDEDGQYLITDGYERGGYYKSIDILAIAKWISEQENKTVYYPLPEECNSREMIDAMKEELRKVKWRDQ